MKVYSLVAREGEPRYLQAVQGDYWFGQHGYGMAGHQYTALIEARWRQLMGLEDNGVGYEPRAEG